MPHGHCTLPADDAGRILDRLAGLEQVIPAEAVRQALQATGRTSQITADPRGRLRVVLAMGLLTQSPIRQVFKHARRLRSARVAHRSNLCVAGQRLGIAPMRRLFKTVRPLARPERRGLLRRIPPDGDRRRRLRCPRLRRQRGGLRTPSAGPRATACPEVRKLSLVELGTHAQVAFVVRPITHGEQGMVGALLRHLEPETLLLWDRGFFSYGLWKEVTPLA